LLADPRLDYSEVFIGEVLPCTSSLDRFLSFQTLLGNVYTGRDRQTESHFLYPLPELVEGESAVG